VKLLGGKSLHTPQQHSALDVSLVSLGSHQMADLNSRPSSSSCAAAALAARGGSRMCAAMFVEKLCLTSVCDLFTLRDHVEDVVAETRAASSSSPVDAGAPAMPLSCIMLLLRLSCWDPDCLWQFGDRILEIVSESPEWNADTASSARQLWQALPSIEEGFTPRFDPDGSTRLALDAATLALRKVFGDE